MVSHAAARRVATPLRRLEARYAACAGSCRRRAFANISHIPSNVNLAALREKQPKEMLRNDVFQPIVPEDMGPSSLYRLALRPVMTNPARILAEYRRHCNWGDKPEVSVVIRAFVQLGFLFDPNSFFATADRQRLTTHLHFRELAHDLAAAAGEIPDAAAPVLLYAMACLEYRCVPLLPRLLDSIERNLELWRTEVLGLALHSVASLGLGDASGGPIVFDVGGGQQSRDYMHLCAKLTAELGHRALDADGGDVAFTGSAHGGQMGPEAITPLHGWSSAAFSVAMAGLYDVTARGSDQYVLPALIARACDSVGGKQDLDHSGWAQFFLYQTLYCVDVEKPQAEEAVKVAMPMWMQERLHERWLDNIVLSAQPQGADDLQRDVDAALTRTNTQALLNCSAGRDWDEQHCWFAGFLLRPKVALECDSMMPLGPGRPSPSGWLSMKSRVLRRMGYTVVTIHRCFWNGLTEDQKDEQLMRLRAEVGYIHDKDQEKRERKIRQHAHVYKGIETKRKEWKPEPTPASE